MPLLNYFLNVTLRDFNAMSALFKEGWSANKVQTWMRSNMTGYRRSTVQAVKLEVLNMVKHEYAWLHSTKTKIPPKSIFTERDFRAPYTYWIHYDVDLIDDVTGKTERLQQSAFADTLKSPQDWEDYIISHLNPTNYPGIAGFSNVQIKGVDHQAGFMY